MALSSATSAMTTIVLIVVGSAWLTAVSTSLFHLDRPSSSGSAIRRFTVSNEPRSAITIRDTPDRHNTDNGRIWGAS